jgi:membrane protein
MNHIPFQEITPLVKVAFQNWQNDRAPRMGAALAYYIARSFAPTVLILLTIAGLAFGAEFTRAYACRLGSMSAAKNHLVGS